MNYIIKLNLCPSKISYDKNYYFSIYTRFYIIIKNILY